MNLFQAVGVSSHTGEGFEEFLAAVENSREEYKKFDAVLKLVLSSNKDNSFFLETTFQN